MKFAYHLISLMVRVTTFEAIYLLVIVADILSPTPYTELMQNL